MITRILNWLKGLRGATDEVLPMSRQAKESIKVAKAKMRKNPCKNHNSPAPSITDVDSQGELDGKRFWERCGKCGWLIRK